MRSKMFALLAVFAVLSVIPACQPLKIVRPAAAQNTQADKIGPMIISAEKKSGFVRFTLLQIGKSGRKFAPDTPQGWTFQAFINAETNGGYRGWILGATPNIWKKHKGMAALWKDDGRGWSSREPDFLIPVEVKGKTVTASLPNAMIEDDGWLVYSIELYGIGDDLGASLEREVNGRTRLSLGAFDGH